MRARVAAPLAVRWARAAFVSVMTQPYHKMGFMAHFYGPFSPFSERTASVRSRPRPAQRDDDRDSQQYLSFGRSEQHWQELPRREQQILLMREGCSITVSAYV